MRWWGDPDEQYALVSGDLDHPDMDQFIVASDDHPFGYIQCYPLEHLESGFWLATRGHARHRSVHRRTRHDRTRSWLELHPAIRRRLLASGIPRVVTDPDPDNRRAVRAYAKAGFQSDRVVDTPDGPALLMVRDP